MYELPLVKAHEILIYLRKSRADDPSFTVAEILSKHERMLDSWVEQRLPDAGGRVPDANRYREVVSGETIQARPKIQELLRRIESREIKAVLIVEPQRLTRGDLEDIGRLVKLLRFSNTLVFTLQYNYDLRDDQDRDAFERELKRGNEYLEYQKRIMNNGRLLAVESGQFIGNRPPYGFKRKTVKDGRRTCRTLEPHPDEAPVVKMIFEMFAKGYGAGRICDTLDGMGIPAPKAKRWQPDSLKAMRTNEHYIGKVRWNHRQTVKIVEGGEVKKTRPCASEYLVYEGLHDAIVPPELYQAVQELKGTTPRNTRGTECKNPFAGLLFCQCGRALHRRQYVEKGVERAAPRLVCGASKHCGSASCTVEEMAEEIAKALRDSIEDFSVRIKSDAGDSMALHLQLVARLERDLQELEEVEASQWDALTRKGMPQHIFDRLNAEVLEKKEEINAALCTAKKATPEPVDYQERMATFSEALQALQDPAAPAREKNKLLKMCIDRIEYTRRRKGGQNPRWGQGQPIELDVHLRV